MKKNICSIITALALCLCLLPAAALAEETETVPAEPTVDTDQRMIYANGVPITIEAGQTEGFSKIKFNDTYYLNFNTGGAPVEEAKLSSYVIYGGAKDGTVSSTSVTMESGNVRFIYGGGAKGAVNGDTSVTMKGGSVSAILGGGENGVVTGNTSVIVKGGKTEDVYGGGLEGRVNGQATVTVSGGTVAGYLYGGGWQGGSSVGTALVTVSGGTVGTGDSSIISGGGRGSSVDGQASITIEGNAQVKGRVYGGGSAVETTTVTVSGGTVDGNVYGGCQSGDVRGQASVAIAGTAHVKGSVYGGPYAKTTSVTVSGGTVDGQVYGGGESGDGVTGAKTGLVTLAGKADAASFDNLLYRADETNWKSKGSYTLEKNRALELPVNSTLTIEPDADVTIDGTLAIGANVELGQMAVGSGGALVVQGKLNANRLQLTQGAALTVADGGALEVNTLHLDGIETLTIDKGGSLTADLIDQDPESPVTVVNDGVLTIDKYIYGFYTGTGKITSRLYTLPALDLKTDLFAPGVTWDAESRTLTLSGAGLGAVQFPADAAIVLEPGTDNLIYQGVLAAGNLTVRGSAGASLYVQPDLQADGTVTVDGASLTLKNDSQAVSLTCAKLEQTNGGVVNGVVNAADTEGCTVYGRVDYTVDEKYIKSGLTVAPGATLALTRDSAVTVSGWLNNQGAIVVMDDAALQFEGDVAIQNPGQIVMIGGSASIPDTLKAAAGETLVEEPYPIHIAGGDTDKDFIYDSKRKILYVLPGSTLTLSDIPGLAYKELGVTIGSPDSDAPNTAHTDLTLRGVTLPELLIDTPTALHLSGENSVEYITAQDDTTIDGSGSLETADIYVPNSALAFLGGTVNIRGFTTAIKVLVAGESAQCPVTFGPGMRLDPDCAFQGVPFDGIDSQGNPVPSTIFYLTENGAALELDEHGEPTNTVKSLRIYPQRSSGGGSASYLITATAGAGGSITPSGKVSVNRNGSKTFAITAESGYEVADVLVDGESVGAVSTYTFEKVQKAHTIETRFQKQENQNADTPFTDVKESDWFYSSVLYVYREGLMNGTGAAAFSPNGTVSRGQIAAILWRMAGSPAPASGSVYHDVAGGRYYTDAVSWCAAEGIMGGYGGGRFGPDDPVTREQLAAILFRCAGREGRDTAARGDLSGFADADGVSAWAREAMQWAVGAGILSGDTNGALAPQLTATRAELSAILMRYLTQS